MSDMWLMKWVVHLVSSQLQVLVAKRPSFCGSCETTIFGMALGTGLCSDTKTIKSLMHQDYGHGYLLE